MIRNLTHQEWDAILSAVSLQDVTWEQDGDENGIDSRTAHNKRRALDRALRKVHQLAPDDTHLTDQRS